MDEQQQMLLVYDSARVCVQSTVVYLCVVCCQSMGQWVEKHSSIIAVACTVCNEVSSLIGCVFVWLGVHAYRVACACISHVVMLCVHAYHADSLGVSWGDAVLWSSTAVVEQDLEAKWLQRASVIISKDVKSRSLAALETKEPLNWSARACKSGWEA